MISKPKRFTNFRWAFSTLGCPELELNDICELARSFEMDCIELRAANGTVDLPKLFGERFGNPDSLARYLEDQQMTFSCLDTSLKLIDRDESARNDFLNFLPWADATKTKTLRVFDGGTVEDGLNDAAFDQAENSLDWWQKEKAASNWKADIAIETHDALVGTRSIDRILKSYPDLKIIWDTHHTWKKSNEAPETTWKHLGPNVSSVHIKDSTSVPSARHPFTYVNLGNGEFPLDSTLNLLEGNKYTGYVSIEWERMWHPYLSDIRDALRRARDLDWF